MLKIRLGLNLAMLSPNFLAFFQPFNVFTNVLNISGNVLTNVLANVLGFFGIDLVLLRFELYKDTVTKDGTSGSFSREPTRSRRLRASQSFASLLPYQCFELIRLRADLQDGAHSQRSRPEKRAH
jgi:hypothetical protein